MHKEEQAMNTYYNSKANSLVLPTSGQQQYLAIMYQNISLVWYTRRSTTMPCNVYQNILKSTIIIYPTTKLGKT